MVKKRVGRFEYGIFPLLISVLMVLFSGCVPNQGVHHKAKLDRPHLLAVSDAVSEVRPILMKGYSKRLSKKVFSRVSRRLKSATEKQLHQTGRWREGGDIALHLEIEQIRLRKTAAVLLLYLVSGKDEMTVNVWITKAGEVIASDRLTTRFEGGGLYGTLPLGKRLDMLSDQIARKLVRTCL